MIALSDEATLKGRVLSLIVSNCVNLGHGGWVTTIAVGEEQVGDEKVEFLLSGSRDKTLIKWELDTKKDDEPDKEWGKPRKMFTGKSCDSILTLFL